MWRRSTGKRWQHRRPPSRPRPHHRHRQRPPRRRKLEWTASSYRLLGLAGPHHRRSTTRRRRSTSGAEPTHPEGVSHALSHDARREATASDSGLRQARQRVWITSLNPKLGCNVRPRRSLSRPRSPRPARPRPPRISSQPCGAKSVTGVLDRRGLNRATLQRQFLLRRTPPPVTGVIEYLGGVWRHMGHAHGYEAPRASGSGCPNSRRSSFAGATSVRSSWLTRATSRW